MVLGSVQPSYLPWIPFFARMLKSDVFVYLDDVQYSKNNFHNRNRIKTSNGALYLTVPVLYKGHSGTYICDIHIDNKVCWQKKHWNSIVLNYKKAPYFKEVAALLEDIYFEKTWDTLGECNIAIIERIKTYLEISTPCYRSSELAVEGKANEKLVNLCKRLQADSFIVKPGTQHYHPPEYFEPRGISFTYFEYAPPVYSQAGNEFIPHLSILDFIMNMGKNTSLLS